MKSTGVLALGLVLTMNCTATAQPVGKLTLSIKIQTPTQKELVEVMHKVAGTVSERSAKVWLVVQPRETTDCWIQKPILVNSDGSWQLMAQFGEEKSEHSGKSYEIRALANPKSTMRIGKTSCWPEAAVYSDPVYVVRK